SVRRFHPESRIFLGCSDSIEGVAAEDVSLFDAILTLDDLPIRASRSWIFKHTTIELCCAMKGLAARELFRRYDLESLLYFDADMVVFAPLVPLAEMLSRHSVIVTPHICHPESGTGAVIRNEITPLRYGIFNLGFMGA